MPELNWVIDVEINVLRALIVVTSILMNVLCVLIGWGLAQAFVNFAVDIFFTKSVPIDGLLLMVAVLFVDSHVERQLSLFAIYLLYTYQNPGYFIYSELFSIPDNSTLPRLLS